MAESGLRLMLLLSGVIHSTADFQYPDNIRRQSTENRGALRTVDRASQVKLTLTGRRAGGLPSKRLMRYGFVGAQHEEVIT